MTEKRSSKTLARRAAAEREILDAAWTLMAREGVAAISVREVARSVGLRQQSLTYYFPTKQALLDALFADGFGALRQTLEAVPSRRDPIKAVADVAAAVVEFCVTHPARYHLMLQGTVPGFEPSEENHRIALDCLGILVHHLAGAGVTKPGDIALVRGLISGLAAEQIANDPGGRQFVKQVPRGIEALLTSMTRKQRKPRTSSRPTHDTVRH